MHEIFSLVFLTSLHTESSFLAIVTATQKNNNKKKKKSTSSLPFLCKLPSQQRRLLGYKEREKALQL